MMEENTMQNYEKTFNDYWKGLVCDENGELDKDAVMRELADYKILFDNVPKVYSAVTGNTLSKLFYPAETVIGVFNEKYYNKASAAELIEDDFDSITEKCVTKEDFKKAIFDYFDIKTED